MARCNTPGHAFLQHAALQNDSNVARALQNARGSHRTLQARRNVANAKSHMSSRIPTLLLNNNLISQETFLLFKSRQKDSGNSVVTELGKLGVLTEDQIADFLSS